MAEQAGSRGGEGPGRPPWRLLRLRRPDDHVVRATRILLPISDLVRRGGRGSLAVAKTLTSLRNTVSL